MGIPIFFVTKMFSTVPRGSIKMVQTSKHCNAANIKVENCAFKNRPSVPGSTFFSFQKENSFRCQNHDNTVMSGVSSGINPHFQLRHYTHRRGDFMQIQQHLNDPSEAINQLPSVRVFNIFSYHYCLSIKYQSLSINLNRLSLKNKFMT